VVAARLGLPTLSPAGYGGQVGTPGQGQLDGHEDSFTSNTLVLNQDGDYTKPICSGRGKNILGNNSIFSPTGAITECGATLAAWQAQVRGLGLVAVTKC
jgi:hypothetical protein